MSGHIIDVPVELWQLIVKKPNTSKQENNSPASAYAEASNIKAYRRLLEDFEPAIQGEKGDSTTFKAACKGRDYKLSKETTLASMWEIYNSRCLPPWTYNELSQKVDSAFSYPADRLKQTDYAYFLPDESTTERETSKLQILHRKASSIQPKQINWLWGGYIARGKLTILAGNPGLGKSQMTANFAATITIGGLWPDQTTMREPGVVVFLSSEDDPEDTIVPRLKAAGADLEKIEFLNNMTLQQGSVNLQDHIRELESTLVEIGNVALLVIDPITAYLGGVDSHKNADVRALFTPLSEMASQLKIAVVCVSHLTKAKGNGALMSVTGSLAFVAAARAAFVVAKHPDNENERVFLPLKNNIGLDSGGFAYTIESTTVACDTMEIATSRIVWSKEPVTLTADQAFATSTEGVKVSALDDAKAFLKEALSNGSRLALEIQEEAKAMGISIATLRRAKGILKIHSPRQGYQGQIFWSLPNDYTSHLLNKSNVAQGEI